MAEAKPMRMSTPMNTLYLLYSVVSPKSSFTVLGRSSTPTDSVRSCLATFEARRPAKRPSASIDAAEVSLWNAFMSFSRSSWRGVGERWELEGGG